MKRLFVTIVLLGNIIMAKAEDVFLQQYGINEGLSSNVVFGIVSDNNGLLWIATTEGVDKFDGLHFKHYTLPQFALNGVLDYMKLFIQSDSKGHIWLATRTGLIYKYDILKDEFQLIHQFQQKANTHSLARLRTFAIDHHDNVLISMNDGVWQMNRSTYQIHKISSNNSVLAMSQDKEHTYYWSDQNGIQVLDSLFQEIGYLYPEGEMQSSSHRTTRLYIDNHSRTLWGVSEKEGVFFIDLTNSKITFPTPLSRYKHLAIRVIHRFSDDEIVIGVDGVGLVIWNIKTQSATKEITYQDGKTGSLSSNAIYDIYQNHDGIFFISTHRGGINVYNPNKLNFGYLNSIPNSKHSLINNYVLSLLELSPGIIGFGTYEGISIWEKKRDRWQHLTEEDLNISEVIQSLAVDNNQHLWATSFTHSPMFFEKNATSYTGSQRLKKLRNIRPKKLCIDRQNRIWFCDHTGLYLFAIEDNSLDHFPLDGVLTLMPLTENLLVLGNENGLSFFNTETFKFHHFDFVDEAQMDMRLIKSLRLDRQNRLWVGTKIDGLFMVDFQNKTIKRLSVKDGLPSNHIFGIAAAKTEVWVSTLKGISKVNNDFSIVNYTLSDGIASIDFNYDAALCEYDGMLYFGTNDGVITLNPQDVPSVRLHKQLVFSAFRLNHKRILPGEGTLLPSETNQVNELKLKHDQNSFSLEFECVDFVQPERGFLHWKLENFDEKWLVSDKLSDITYTHLNPGTYTFRIKVLDEQGALISNEKTIHITISHPWWFTAWAFVVYSLSIILLFWAILYFYRLRIYSKSSAERLGFLINLAHEIKTPLLLIKAPLHDLMSHQNTSGTIRKNVNIALSNAERLHRQIIQFLDMGNLARIENTLTFEHMDLVQGIQKKVTAFKVLAEKKDISLTFHHDMSDFYIQMDQEVMDKIVSNLLSNAIKYTHKGGTVKLKLMVVDGFCRIRVIDNGIGISRSDKKHIFKPFFRTDMARKSNVTGNGIGLVLANNMAKMLKGKLSLIESSEKGTTFEFKFPFERSEKNALTIETSEQKPKQDSMRIRLLLVEDDADLLAYGVSKLKEHYQVITARNGIEGIERTRQVLPNIIISDIRMPQMNGLQLCVKLKADIRTSHIPIILFTGLDQKEEVLEGLEAGADDYIVKPFEFDILIKKIDTLLYNRLLLQKKFLFQINENEAVGFASKLDDEWIQEVNTFVEQHIGDSELTPAVLYRQFGMSRSAFYHKTKSLVDLSPHELIRTIRLKKAKSLLGRADNDISEVAYKLGFNDPKYFSTVFKRYFGQTPSSFIAEKKMLEES